jgi:ribosome biogenesis GTPase
VDYLKTYGWDDDWQEVYHESGIEMPVGRVTGRYGRLLKCITDQGELLAEISGRLSYLSTGASDLPVPGDWVLILMEDGSNTGLVYDVLPRRSWLARRRGENIHFEQLMAANVDFLCVVSALDGTLNLNRIERYLFLAAEGQVAPLVLLNKTDLCGDLEEVGERITGRFSAVPVYYLSCKHGSGIENLRASLQRQKTYAFVGPSGVGKSTIINTLLGEERQKTAEVREVDHRGRHVTSSRELFLTPAGALLVDTPGLRELVLTGEKGALDEVYGTIAEAAQHCRFRDCTHTVEQGCAVIESVESGEIPAGQYENYLKMRRELQHLERKEEQGGSYNPKRRWKDISKEIRRLKDRKK